MIHTFEIKAAFSHSQISSVNETLSKSLLTQETPATLTDPFGIPGIQKATLTVAPNVSIYYLALVIEPLTLVQGTKSMELFPVDELTIEILKQKLYSTLKGICSELSFNKVNWWLSRLDIAFQIHTPYVSTYVGLAQKATVPYWYRKIGWSAGSDYVGSKSTYYNFYDKYDQAENKGYPDFLLAEASNVYRMEIQLRTRKKIKYLMKKYELDDNVWSLFNSDIILTEFKTAYVKHIGTGDYYTFDKASERIQELGKRPKSKQLAIDLLRFINNHQSFPDALLAINNGSEDFLSRYQLANGNVNIDKFKRDVKTNLISLGINPILLPDSFEADILENPFDTLF